jgi:amino acid transporter
MAAFVRVHGTLACGAEVAWGESRVTTDMRTPETTKLRRVLGARDVILLTIVAVVALRWLSVAAQLGPAGLTLWLLGALLFEIPLGLAVLELGSRNPGEGGLYLWSKEAFGERHGFIAAWTYWLSNLVSVPSSLLFTAGMFWYVGGARWMHLAGSPGYNAALCLAVLWGATLFNVRGLDRAKWLPNVGAVAVWVVTALVVLAGAVAWYRFGPATAITPRSLVPDFGSASTFAIFAMMALAYDGLELGPVMGGEIRDPRRVMPRAILVAMIGIALIYMAGTASLLIALPREQIDLIGGIPQTLMAVSTRLGLPAFAPIAALLIVIANVGNVSGWTAGTARIPFVIGVDRYLPAVLGRLHPVHGTPWVALLVQGVVGTAVVLMALAGATIREAFVVLIDMTAILTFVPLMYLFAALPTLRLLARGRNDGLTLVPGGAAGSWLCGGAGFLTTALATVTSMIPPAGSNPTLFLLKVIGGCALLVGVGLIFFERGWRAHGADSGEPGSR